MMTSRMAGALRFRVALWRYNTNKLGEKLLTAIVWRLPRRLVYWSAIRVIAHATSGQYSHTVVPELPAMEALKRWDG